MKRMIKGEVADLIDNHVAILPDFGPVLDGNLGVDGNLAATGSINAPEIVEQMSGYTFDKNNDAYMEYLYVGAVKNGNKLTLVVYGKITPTETLATNLVIGTFHVSDGVYSKLYPTTLPTAPAYYALDVRSLPLFTNLAATPALNLAISSEKTSVNNGIRLVLRGAASMSTNTTYLYRYEITFLLSDNLAPANP